MPPSMEVVCVWCQPWCLLLLAVSGFLYCNKCLLPRQEPSWPKWGRQISHCYFTTIFWSVKVSCKVFLWLLPGPVFNLKCFFLFQKSKDNLLYIFHLGCWGFFFFFSCCSSYAFQFSPMLSSKGMLFLFSLCFACCLVVLKSFPLDK